MTTNKILHDVDTYIALGEYCLISAPIVNLPNGQSCVPQHFYGYNHTLESVESILEHIFFSYQYPIFCAEDEQGLFIQIGIIGRENYQRHIPDRAKKIVYGRKWRVEPNLPTSEIIQTVFLAIKKAREHEIRELVILDSLDGTRASTPFNSHHDLPLMTHCSSFFKYVEGKETLTIESVQSILNSLCFDQTTIKCMDVMYRRNGNVLIDIVFDVGNVEQDKYIEFSELHGIECTLILKTPSANELLYELMDTLIGLSDRYVEKHFTFNGFNRFSREHDLRQIGEFSINTRLIKSNMLDAKGKKLISEHNCSVDASRAPNIKLDQQRIRLAESFKNKELMEGFLPKGF